MTSKKILAVTGIRSEFDILYPILSLLQQSEKFKLEIVACGTHLVEKFGNTVQLIADCDFIIADRIDYLLYSNTDSARAKGISLLLDGLINCVVRTKPDFLLVVGDREESIATGIVGNYLKIPVIHIGGGDEAINNADDPIRHATSKLAHIHFTTCEKFKQNLLLMGEEPFRVHNAGNPSLERIRNTQALSRQELSSLIGFDLGKDSEPFLLVLQHPLSSESVFAYIQMKKTMDAIAKLKIKSIIVYPNSDPGSSDIIRAIEEYRDEKHIYICENLDRIRFVNALRHMSCMVGNSSSGLLEAPFVKKPVVNIGNRQKGRINAGNVLFIPHETEVIIKTIHQLIYNKEYQKTFIEGINQYYYGDGYGAEKIVAILEDIELPYNNIIKVNTWSAQL